MEQNSSNANYDCLTFDIDDTLYPYSSGLGAQITKNIEAYMIEKLGIQEEKAPELSLLLYHQYGTTLAGLRAIGYDFDYDDFHGYVHGRLPYGDLLKPDPVLRNLLLSLPIRKVAFTNADAAHASKVLGRLDLEDCFECVICFETLNPVPNGSNASGNTSESVTGTLTESKEIFDIMGENVQISEYPKTPVVCKPFAEAFEQFFKMANINPQRTLFFDDSVRNIQAGKLVGLHTVLVGKSQKVKGADYALESIHNIREALPELWLALEKTEKVEYTEKVAVETSVRA
ncbi:unnamed protein product [Rhodiola kirilowii]